jgi:radical SAM protein with 4Fe4S-binding SPASM domain
MVSVSISGDIYPCHRFTGQEDAKLGNIEDYKCDGMNDYHPLCREMAKPDCEKRKSNRMYTHRQCKISTTYCETARPETPLYQESPL